MRIVLGLGKAGQPTNFQVGDVIDCRLENGTFGVTRDNERIRNAESGDDRFMIDPDGMSFTAALNYLGFIAGSHGCEAVIIRDGEGVLIVQLIPMVLTSEQFTRAIAGQRESRES